MSELWLREWWDAGRSLFRETFQWLHDHPVLFLPYLCAESFDFLSKYLRQWILQGIIQWSFTHSGQSVLNGGSLGSGEGLPAQQKAWLVGTPLELGIRYISVCVLVLAFVMTERMVLTIRENLELNTSTIFGGLRDYAGRILWFSLKLCIFAVILMLPVLWLGVAPVDAVRDRLHVDFDTFVWGFAFLLGSALAGLVAPMAMKLIAPEKATAIGSLIYFHGRLTAMVAFAAAAILGYGYVRLYGHIRLESAAQYAVLGFAATIVTNVPLVFLFIALTLLVMQSGELSSGEPGMDALIPQSE